MIAALLLLWFSGLLPMANPQQRWTATTSQSPSRAWISQSLHAERTAIHLTKDNQIVSIHINITRLDCEPFQDLNVTTSTLALDLIHRHYGPDEMLVYFGE